MSLRKKMKKITLPVIDRYTKLGAHNTVHKPLHPGTLVKDALIHNHSFICN